MCVHRGICEAFARVVRLVIVLRYPRTCQCRTIRSRSSVRTKDLLYESNDSREILNGSFSLKTLRWLLLVVLRDDDVQKLRRSLGGDGGTKTPESLISIDACESTFVGKW